MGNDEKIRKWLAGDMLEEEKREFEASSEYRKIHRLLKAVQSFKAQTYNVDKEYSNFYKRVIHQPKKNTFIRNISPLLRVAAIIILVILTGVFSYTYLIDSENTSGWITEQKVVLPDSSLVLINSGSQIKYSTKSWDKNRIVELKGEAFFRVGKGSRFNVKTKQGLVTVLGTEFCVKDRNNYYEVSCYEGKVKVAIAQNNITLEPNSVFRIINKKQENFVISNKSQPDWLRGESNFKSVPLEFVFDELERQYNISVSTSNVNLNQLFTGSFLHQDLDIALESITFPVNLDYKINGDKVEITIEGK